MASLLLGGIGGAFFGPFGFLVGSALGTLLDPPKSEGPRLSDLKLQGSSYGTPIPIVYGGVRIAGQIVDQTDLVEHKHTQGGKGGPRTTTYTYTASFLVQICEGPISSIRSIWADKQLIWQVGGTDDVPMPCKLFKGSEDQLPSSTFEGVRGVGNVPAYRGTAIGEFTDYLLSNFGNRIPSLEFEVLTTTGDIPIRISTFEPRPEGTGSALFNGPVTFDGTLMTVVEWYSDLRWIENRFNISGTFIDQPLNIVAQNIPDSGGVFTIPHAQCQNIPVWFAYASSGARMNQWYRHGLPIGQVANFGTGLPEDTVGSMPMWANDVLYAVGPGVLAAFSAPDGVPALAPTIQVAIAGSDPSLYKLGISDDGFIYLGFDTGFSSALYKYDTQLNLVKTWLAGTTPTGFGAGSSFIIHNGQLVFNSTDSSAYACFVYTMNDDGTFTFVGKAAQTQTGCVYLGSGYLLGGDGVLSLNPPVLTVSLASIVLDISERCGLQSSEVDVTDLDQRVRGYVIGSQMIGRNAIQPLREAFFFDGVESGDIVKFVNEGHDPIVTIPTADLAATTPGAQSPSLIQPERTQEADLPRRIFVKYFNVDAAYQDGTQVAQRQVTYSELDTSFDLPIVFNDNEAAAIANTKLMKAWIERQGYQLFTTRQYEKYEPTDVMVAEGRTFRIKTKEDQVNTIIKWQGVEADSSIFVQTTPGSGSDGWRDPGVPPGAQGTLLVPLDIPLIKDTDTVNGPYFATAGARNDNWAGATIYKSSDGGVSYDPLATTQNSNTIGVTRTALGAFYGGNVVDEINSVDILVGNGGGELSSTTYLGLLNGINIGIIGNEMLQWRTATLIAAFTYRLTGLLRGRRGTEWAIKTHPIGERFVAFNPELTNVDMQAYELNLERDYKAVTLAQTNSNVVVPFTNTGNTLKCYAPTGLGGGLFGSGNDVLLRWVRRTRIGGAWVDLIDVPLSETTESYVIQIWDSTYTMCARIIGPITGAQATIYGATEQTADFGAAQAHIYFSVGQVGAFKFGSQAFGVGICGGATDDFPITPIQPYVFIPAQPPPPPPGGGPPTGPVDKTITTPFESWTKTLTSGARYVAQFTMPALFHRAELTCSEYGGAAAQRHMFVATNSGGTNIISGSQSYGSTVSCILTGLTPGSTYYAFFDFLAADGSFLESPGSTHPSIFQFNSYTS